MKCLICQKEFKTLTNSHLKKHNLTPKEYEIMFGVKTVYEGYSVGENNSFYGKKHIKGKSFVKSKKFAENARQRRLGKKCEEYLVNVRPEEHRYNLSVSHKGENNAMFGYTYSKERIDYYKDIFAKENNPNWRGGITENGYPCEFSDNLKDDVRKLHNSRCFICGRTQSAFYRKLDVHHIDYNKENLELLNLVPLCQRCHVKTNYIRFFWEIVLSVTLNNILYGNHEPSLNGNILEGATTIRCSLTYNDEGNNSYKSARPHASMGDDIV